MARSNRKETVDPLQVANYHCVSRVVRQARLLGSDPYTGKNYDHRKGWVEKMTRDFAGYFGIDVIAIAILINHMHHLLRSRPDIVAKWSDEEVARRWLCICPGTRKGKRKNGNKPENGEAKDPDQPSSKEVNELAKDKKKIAKIRIRLSNISWFMGKLKERIARRANAEDETTGRFWEGRFKCTRLDSPAACLACAVYIDLNMVRAGLASCPENSYYTSIYRRIVANQSRRLKREKLGVKNDSQLPYDPEADSYLAPTYELEHSREQEFAKLGRRASDDPAFDIDFEQYVDLVDRTGRQIVPNKKGSIPVNLPPVLERLGIEPKHWVESIREFGQWTRRVVGTPNAMEAAAAKAGRKWYQGIANCRMLFVEAPPDS